MRCDAFDGFLGIAAPTAPSRRYRRRGSSALQRDAPYEPVPVINVEYKNARAAVTQIVAAADARQRRIQEPLRLLRVRL